MIRPIPSKEVFQHIEDAIKKGLPFVSYRKPGQSRLQLWIQQGKKKYETTDFSQKGFVMAPFDLDQNKAVFFPEDKCLRYAADIQIRNSLKKKSKQSVNQDDKTKAAYTKLVKRAVHFITEGAADKIVTSRKIRLFKEVPNKPALFQKLLDTYPDAFVYIWYHPEVGFWLGATPETLLQAGQNTFKTMALAGTQQFKAGVDVIWQEKEQKEQAFVTQYILEKLRGLDVSASKAYTKKAGNLLHICTDITGKIDDRSIDKLIKDLHPTPAVCGLPLGKAKQFILENEGYDRQFYTGFLGELNVQDKTPKKTDLCVNLRCMAIPQGEPATVHIYVGGGITSGSDPEKEWLETVAKGQTMQSVIFS